MSASGVVIHRCDTAPSHRSRVARSACAASSGCVRRRRFARVSHPQTITPCRSTVPSSAKQGLSPAHSMSSTRASASSGTNAVTRTDMPSTLRSHAAQPKPYSTRTCPSSSKSDTAPARDAMHSVSVPRSTHGSHSQRLMRPVCALRCHMWPVPASVARKPKRPLVSTWLHARGGSPVKDTVPSSSQCTSAPVGRYRRSPGGGSSGSVQRVRAMPGRMAAAAATAGKAPSGTRCTPPGASSVCARSSAASQPRTFPAVGCW